MSTLEDLLRTFTICASASKELEAHNRTHTSAELADHAAGQALAFEEAARLTQAAIDYRDLCEVLLLNALVETRDEAQCKARMLAVWHGSEAGALAYARRNSSI